jgi:hypothetical protein
MRVAIIFTKQLIFIHQNRQHSIMDLNDAAPKKDSSSVIQN